MESGKRLITAIVIIILGMQLLSCSINQMTPSKMSDCHDLIESAEELDESLLGKWEWKSVKCDFKVENKIKDVYKNVEIEFIGRDTIQFRYKGEIVGGHNRQIDVPFIWNQEIDPEWNPVYLHIGNNFQLCNNKLLFLYRQVDGCDNLFKRIE